MFRVDFGARGGGLISSHAASPGGLPRHRLSASQPPPGRYPRRNRSTNRRWKATARANHQAAVTSRGFAIPEEFRTVHPAGLVAAQDVNPRRRDGVRIGARLGAPPTPPPGSVTSAPASAAKKRRSTSSWRRSSIPKAPRRKGLNGAAQSGGSQGGPGGLRGRRWR
jgi:hypothetical protein